MSGEKKVLLPTYRLYDGGGDLSKKWFVYWYEGTTRKRKYGAINQNKTARARRAAAEQLTKELKAEHQRRITKVETVMREYIQAGWGQWSRKTREEYTSNANRFIEFLSGREVTQELVEDFLMHVRNAKHPTTYNKYLAYLKRLLTACGYEFFFDDFKRLKTNPTPARYFQRYQATRLLRDIDEQEPDLGLFVRFIYYCFIRPGELRRLRVGDILMEEAQIRVPGEISKNNKTQFIVVPDMFLPRLQDLYDRSPGEYVFPSPEDATKPIGKNTMYRRHRAILQQLNFGKGYSLYSWKHTGAVMAAKAGISVKELQLQLRHHSLDETDKYLRQMGVKDLSTLQRQFPAL